MNRADRRRREALSRPDRRRLERESDRIVRLIAGYELPADVDPAVHYGIYREGAPLAIVTRHELRIIAATLIGDPKLVSDIDSQRPAMHLAVLVRVEDRATVAFVPLTIAPVARGAA